MQNRLQRQIIITPGMCDYSARLGVADTARLFMDIAAEHAEQLGLGGGAMAAKGLFWLSVRTRLRFFERPALMSGVTVATWPGVPSKMRCERYYTISDGEKTLVEGVTEWAVLDIALGKPTAVDSIYPPELQILPDVVCGGEQRRITADFSAADEVLGYTVRSTDIDYGNHMNNVAYIRMIISAFSTRQLAGGDIREFEIFFRSPCKEGEKLSLRALNQDGETLIGVLKADGTAAALVRAKGLFN